MTDSPDTPAQPRPKRGEGAWLDAKKAISDRNDQARKTGKAERTAREQRQKAALRQAERDGVYR